MRFTGENARRSSNLLLSLALSAVLVLAGTTAANAWLFGPGCFLTHEKGDWLAGDFHQHTLYTDGSTTFDFVMSKNNEFGLDWWANSEHGGERNRNGNGDFWDQLNPPVDILGSYEESGGHQEMWRWQSLRDFVFPDILAARAAYPDKRIFSGLEWYVPGHEHCSVAVVGEDATAISAFAYLFDNSLEDVTKTIMDDPRMAAYGDLSVQTKRNGHYDFVQGASSVDYTEKEPPAQHADAVAACAWMQQQYVAGSIDNAWIIFAHIERDGAWTAEDGGGYNIEHFRDFNNAAPDICFGFEGAPGHQVNHWRGFGNEVDTATGESKDFGGTYGGVGYYTAEVGGLWDALLGEGRHWFNFANSDYHAHWTAGGDDFYPGEYQKTWVYAVDADHDGKYSLNEIADGLRSGNAYFVHGDLINYLNFEAESYDGKASMGNDLVIDGSSRFSRGVVLTIRFKSPKTNNNGDTPIVDHIDLIGGEITGKISPRDSNYTKATNDTTKVIARFTAADWTRTRSGYYEIKYRVGNLHKDMYFRLRGTNFPVGTAYETDSEGNPLPDYLATTNLGLDGADEAWADLWFYSSPIFVYVD